MAIHEIGNKPYQVASFFPSGALQAIFQRANQKLHALKCLKWIKYVGIHGKFLDKGLGTPTLDLTDEQSLLNVYYTLVKLPE